MVLDKIERVVDGSLKEFVFVGAMMECPMCMEKFHVTSEFHEKSAVDLLLEDMSKPRPCPKCGVVSGLPERVRNKVELDLLELAGKENYTNAMINGKK